MELDVYKSKGEGGNRTLFGDVLSDQFHSQTWYHSLGSLCPLVLDESPFPGRASCCSPSWGKVMSMVKKSFLRHEGRMCSDLIAHLMLLASVHCSR